MVGGLPARIGIAAVVRGDDQQVVVGKQRQKIAQHRVELFQRFREAFDVFSMAVQHVEIDQIAEDQSVGTFVHGGS